MVYTIANLYLFHGLLKFVYNNGLAVNKKLAIENGDIIAKGGALVHPRERINMLARISTELGFLDQTNEDYKLTAIGKTYVEMMGEDIWGITENQAAFLQNLIFSIKKETRLSETVRKSYELLKKYKLINPNTLSDEYAELIGRQDWNSVTRLDKFKFTLNYLCDMGLAKRDKGEYMLANDRNQTITSISVRCTKVQKRPSPELESLATGESILIVKDSSIARNTLLYPAYSSASATDFKDTDRAQKAIDTARNSQITLNYFIYPVRIYKLKNKSEVSRFASEFQPWTMKAFEDWRPGKSNIIAALLRVYKTNPIVVNPIGNMNIVPLPAPVDVTSLSPVVSDEEFLKKSNEIEQALKKYDLVEDKKIHRAFFKLNIGSNIRQWAIYQAHRLIGFDYDYLGDIKKLQQKHPSNNALATQLNSIGNGHALHFFDQLNIGDIIVITENNNEILGIGKITSDYIFDARREYIKHLRKVRWLYSKPVTEYLSTLPVPTITQAKFITLAQEEWNGMEFKEIVGSPKSFKISARKLV